MNRPMVSIVVNCFNGAATLTKALDSIFAQTFNDWEVIFWDNNSTDRSAEIACSYGDKIKYYKSKKTTLLGEARENALGKCKGKYVAFLDCDDIWYSNKLKLQVSRLENSDFIMCYAGINEVSPEGKIIRTQIPKYNDGNQLSDLLKQWDINMVTPLIKLDALKHHQITFDKNIVASAEYNIFMRLAAVGKFCSLKEILGEWTIYDNSLTMRSIKNWSEDRRHTLDKLSSEHSDLVNIHLKEFRMAYARADYYESRFLISSDKWRQARYILKKNITVSKTYFALWVLSMVPSLWRLFHNEKLKRKISAYIYE